MIRALLAVAVLGLVVLYWFSVDLRNREVGVPSSSSRLAQPSSAAVTNAGAEREDESGRRPLSGDCVRLASKEPGASAQSEDESAASPPEENMDWQEVRSLFSSDFELTEELKEEFLNQMLTVIADVSFNGGIVSLNIKLPEWNDERRRDFVTRLGFSESRYQDLSYDIEQLWTEYLEVLKPLSQSAVGLLRESMQECWRNDMYYRASAGELLGLPEGFWDRQAGVYATQWTAKWGGWEICVSFDSIDFPMLESSLVEIERQKSEFTSRLFALLVQ